MVEGHHLDRERSLRDFVQLVPQHLAALHLRGKTSNRHRELADRGSEGRPDVLEPGREIIDTRLHPSDDDVHPNRFRMGDHDITSPIVSSIGSSSGVGTS